MSYLRVDHKGEMRFITDEKLIQSIAEDHGQILIVTGDTLRTHQVFYKLKAFTDPKGHSLVASQIRTEQSTIRICTSFDWRVYACLRFSSAYIHRDATLKFFFQIMSCVRDQPKEV